MRTFLDAKAMAKSLRSALAGKQITLSHGECLEIVASQFGSENWNVLSARIDSAGSPGLQDAIPILRIFSVEKAKEFYLDFLGFSLDWGTSLRRRLPALCAGFARERDPASQRASRRCKSRIGGDDPDARYRGLQSRAPRQGLSLLQARPRRRAVGRARDEGNGSVRQQAAVQRADRKVTCVSRPPSRRGGSRART